MSSLQNQDSPRISRGRNKFKFHEDYKFIRNRVYLLSAFIGDKQKPFNTYKGFYGLILWTCNLVVHFSLDFYESVHHFHISWSSAIGIYLIGFIIWTIFTIKHTIPWFLKLVQRLTGYKYHKRTINKLVIVFKVRYDVHEDQYIKCKNKVSSPQT